MVPGAGIEPALPCGKGIFLPPADLPLAGSPLFLKDGARGGNRTRTSLRKRDFKSLASTDFATRAPKSTL